MTLWSKVGVQSARIAVSKSYGRDIFELDERRYLSSKNVIDDSTGDSIIRICGTSEDCAVVNVVESWPQRLADLGLRVSTGPVVTFRARKFLLDEHDGDESVPLLSVFNIRAFETVWPIRHRKHPIAFKHCADSLRLLVPSRNYVLLRRFSAKEEFRRLTASCYLAADSTTLFLALENHLNYVYHFNRDLTIDETFGLAGLFNSALLDKYFRTISGNTQVNATELRTMPFPALAVVSRIGRSIRDLPSRTGLEVERIVLEELGVNGSLGRHLLTLAS
ncbi:MAG TPA: hypothetical protein VM120_17865 [Bryobacteraceae bacterium]|nr:hypothetical protein [Bryobacteraceae bacterium]